jgi:hypothetical protein
MSEPYNPPTAPPPSGPPAYPAPGLPWDREKSGNALVDTAKGLITAPTQAFAQMREKGDYASPIFFALIFGTVGAVLGQIWNIVFGGAMTAFMVDMMPPEMRSQMAEAMQPSIVGVIVSIFVAPIVVVVMLFILAGIFHLFLMMVGGTKESTAGFEGTVRALAYSWVTNVAQVIPIVGGFWPLWAMVLSIIGLARVHHTSTGKAAAAVLLPLALCCICLVVAIATMGAAIGAAIAGAANQ